MSGGLDSMLAAKLIVDQGIEVIGIHFLLPISSGDPEKNVSLKHAMDSASKIGMEFRTVRMGEDYIDMLLHPKHGYGSGFNPCADCHIMMLKKTRELMTEVHASFVVSGEVVGQRPMSQLRKKLEIVEKESGLEGYLLRPLSAKQLPETMPEKNGWVDRNKLLGINGRKRNEQITLARNWGFNDYMTPAGGCLFTDKNFGERVREHLKHSKLHLEDFGILKLGRHFRLPDNSKLVVGRNQTENETLHTLAHPTDIIICPHDNVRGPDALLRGTTPSDETITLACEIVTSYCDGDDPAIMNVQVNKTTIKDITAERHQRNDFEKYYI